MNKIIARLRSKAGESLIESMAAILIFTFASIAMYTMIMSSNDINQRAEETEETNMEQMVIAEMAAIEGKIVPKDQIDSEGKKVSHKVIFNISGSKIKVPVDVYGQKDGMYAYYPEGVSNEKAEE